MKTLTDIEHLLKRLNNVCENYENRGTRRYPNSLFEDMDEDEVSAFLYNELVNAINVLEYEGEDF